MRVWLISALALLASVCCSASLFPDEWDDDFSDAVDTYLPVGYDWRLLKAQCYQESLLDPLAVSPVGAYGLCQFMPGTASEVGNALAVGPDQFWLPEVSIRAAGYYMGKLHQFWRSPRPPMDRAMFSLASYNWGAGNVLKSQRQCNGAVLYRHVEPCIVPRETRTYVNRIVTRWWPAMLFE